MEGHTSEQSNLQRDDSYTYYGIMQWTTGDSYIRSTGKGAHKALVDAIPFATSTHPLMNKVVVDDTEFDPNYNALS